MKYSISILPEVHGRLVRRRMALAKKRGITTGKPPTYNEVIKEMLDICRDVRK